MKKLPTQFGFSLIELMIVLVIIGLLVSFAIPNFQNSINKADRLALKTALTVAHLNTKRCYFNQLENYPNNQCNYDYTNIRDDSSLKNFLIADLQDNRFQISFDILLWFSEKKLIFGVKYEFIQ